MPKLNTKKTKKFTGKREKQAKITKYITRGQAIKHLNCTMDQFRKICILKGVYPRLPTKGLNALNQKKIYYHIDDIKPLVHDKVVAKIKAIRAFKRQVRRLEHRKEFHTKAQLMKNKPMINLASTIQERYPTFQDALNELGDCLSMVFMFASYRVSKGEKADAIRVARRIALEWEAYIKHTNSLRKCFISYKGYYYTAIVCGVPVTWMVPHQFAIEKNEAVDFSVLHEFLSFYVVLMKFINYKLYTTAGLVYPPTIEMKNGVEYIGTVQLERLMKNDGKNNKNMKKEMKENEINEPVETNDIDVQQLNEAFMEIGGENVTLATEMIDTSKDSNESKKMEMETFGEIKTNYVQSVGNGLFSGLVFYLQTEVPKKSIGFVIETLGGLIVDDVNDERITHQVGERGQHVKIEREYIQPQWLFDCVNENFLLPCGEYAIGQKLPPHLSPYVDEQEEGYVTERRKQLEAIKNNTTYDYEEEQKKEDDEKNVVVKDIEKDFVDGMMEEMESVSGSKKIKKPQQQMKVKNQEKKKEEEEKKRKMAMMSGKDRKIVMRNEMNEKKQKKKVEKLKGRLAASKMGEN